jgi:hypothetical protein
VPQACSQWMMVPGSSWAHPWAHTLADRHNQTGSDATGPSVLLKKRSQIEPDATRRKKPVRT